MGFGCHRRHVYYKHIRVEVIRNDVACRLLLNKKHKASYIFNYRYSTTGLLNLDGGTMDYQDLNFKLNFPTKMAGTFSVWGTSLIDKFKSDMGGTLRNGNIWATAANHVTSSIWLPEVSVTVTFSIVTHR